MKNNFLFIVLCFFISACASTVQYSSVVNTATGNPIQKSIYILRPSWFRSAIRFGIYEDDKLMGKLGPKSQLAWSASTSKKPLIIKSKSENKDFVSIDPIPGKSYFIQQSAQMGFLVARSKIKLISEDEGKAMLKKLRSPKTKLLKQPTNFDFYLKLWRCFKF